MSHYKHRLYNSIKFVHLISNTDIFTKNQKFNSLNEQ